MTVRLSEIARIVAGGRSGKSGNDFVESGYPAYGAGGLNGELDFWEFDSEGIVLSSIGARCGKCFFPTGKWASLANTQVILPDESMVDRRYLWYQLNDEKGWHRSGTAQPYIKPADVKARTVVLPSLVEQRRIAAILDQADALRERAGAEERLVNDLGGSRYREMFLAAGSADWPTLTVSDLLREGRNAMRTGPFGSQLLKEELVDDGIPVLGIDCTVDNEFRLTGGRFVSPEKYEQLRRYKVSPGDVLITIMGTIGRCVVVPDSIGTALNTKHLVCITLDKERCVPEFLRATFLWHPESRKYLGATGKGAIMTGLNMGIIKEMPVRIPPVALQAEYSRWQSALSEQLASARRRSAELDTLFASLQHRAFRGEL